MTEAPETITIFVDYDDDGVWYELVKEGPVDADDVHYIRADIADAAIRAAVVRALEAAATFAVPIERSLIDRHTDYMDGSRSTGWRINATIRAIATDPAQVARIARGET